MKKLTLPAALRVSFFTLFYIGMVIVAFQSTSPDGLMGLLYSLFVAICFGYMLCLLVENDILKSKDDYPIDIAQRIDLARKNYLSLMVLRAIEGGYVENNGQSVLYPRASYVSKNYSDQGGKRMTLFHHKALRIAAKSQKLTIIQRMSLAKDIHQESLYDLPHLNAHDMMFWKAKIANSSYRLF